MLQSHKILHADTEWHQRFFQFVASIFNGSTERWQLWYDRGGWTEDYEVFAIIDDDRIVSTIGRTRMHLIVNDEMQEGYQLGAVGTFKSYRGQGLARQLMGWIIDELKEPSQPIILFANSSVTDFYPRFGFKRMPQQQSMARISIMESFGEQARRCDPANSTDRLELADLFTRATPIRSPLSARDYYPIALWHLSYRPITAFWCPEFDALIATTVENSKLIIHDVIASQAFDLSLVVPKLISQPITELEFRFNPDDWWPNADRSEFNDADSPLFIRGSAAAVRGRIQCPELAHT